MPTKHEQFIQLFDKLLADGVDYRNSINAPIHKDATRNLDALRRFAKASAPSAASFVGKSNVAYEVVFNPTRWKMGPSKEDESVIKEITSGCLYIAITDPNGQIYRLTDLKGELTFTQFEKLNGDLVEQLIRKNSVAGAAFIDGVDAFSLGREYIPMPPVNGRYQKPNSKDHRQLSLVRHQTALSVPSYDYGDSLSSRGGVTMDHLLSTPYDETYPSTITIHFSRLREAEMYKSLMMEQAFKDNAEPLTALFSQSMMAAITNADTMSNERQKELLGNEASSVPFSGEKAWMYPDVIKNYIANGGTDLIRQYRREFVEISYQFLIGGAQAESEQNDFKMPDFDLMSRLIKMVESPGKLDYLNTPRVNEIMDTIDAGRYPSKEIASLHGCPNVSKKQFKRALSLWGEAKTLSIGSGWNDLADASTPPALEAAFAYAKLPPQWLVWDKDQVPDLFFAQNVKLKDAPLDVWKRTLPFLKRAGQTLDKLDGKIRADKALLLSPDTENKTEIKSRLSGYVRDQKALASQWSWLSEKDKPMLEKIIHFDEKYKVKASFHDYGEMLMNLVDTCVMRSIVDSEELESKDNIVSLDEDNMSVDIDEEELSRQYINHLDSEHAIQDHEPPEDWDEEEYGDYDPEYPSMYTDSLYLPGSMQVGRLTSENQSSFKKMAELNHEMHKSYNVFLREANSTSDENISWTPIVDEPFMLNDQFEARPISDRLDLLEEGQAMGHCVFSYISKCLAGDSVIISVRDKNGSDPENNRVATIELTPIEPEYNEHDSNAFGYEIEQCYGPGNTSSGYVSEIEELVESWLEKVAKGEVPTNGEKITQSGEAAGDLIERVEKDPLEEGGLLKQIPYNSDGAYMAYFQFDKFTPQGCSVEDVVSDNDTAYQFFVGSGFYRDVLAIKELSRKWDVPAMDVVRYKTRHDISEVDKIGPHKEALDTLVLGLSQVVSGSAGQLTAEQVSTDCSDYLKIHGHKVFTDTDALEEMIDRGSVDWEALLLDARPAPLDPITLVNDEKDAPDERVRRSAKMM